MNESTMKVVLMEPGKQAKIADIGTSLESMQRTVGGYIEAVYPFEEEVCIVCNEEGKIYPDHPCVQTGKVQSGIPGKHHPDR